MSLKLSNGICTSLLRPGTKAIASHLADTFSRTVGPEEGRYSMWITDGVAQEDHSRLAGSGGWLAGTSESVEGKG
jgi:hypothetical protein